MYCVLHALLHTITALTTEFTLAIEHNSKVAPYYLGRGRCSYYTGQHSAAFTDSAAALALDPGSSEAQSMLAHFDTEGNAAAAIATARRAKHTAAARAAHQEGLKQRQQSHDSRHAAALQAEHFTAKSSMHSTDAAATAAKLSSAVQHAPTSYYSEKCVAVLLTALLTATTCTVLYTALTLQAGALRPEDSSCSSEHSECDIAGSFLAGGNSVMSTADQSHCLPHIKPLTKTLVLSACTTSMSVLMYLPTLLYSNACTNSPAVVACVLLANAYYAEAAAAKAAARRAAGLTRLQCCHSPIKGRDNAWTLLDRPTRRTSSTQATSSATAIAAKGSSTATRPRVNSSVALSVGSSSRRSSAG
eukprot:8815-Heterococcus_DN1.PRE.1